MFTSRRELLPGALALCMPWQVAEKHKTKIISRIPSPRLLPRVFGARTSVYYFSFRVPKAGKQEAPTAECGEESRAGHASQAPRRQRCRERRTSGR